MNPKKIPVDIDNKTIEEAQKEVKKLLIDLENDDNIDSNSKKEKYKLLISLNDYILKVFKKRSLRISSKDKDKELEKNTVLKNYYESWGSRVYAFYNNQNNIMLNFQAAKKIGADYVISKFPIENNELEKVCSECNGSNEIFLYKIL